MQSIVTRLVTFLILALAVGWAASAASGPGTTAEGRDTKKLEIRIFQIDTNAFYTNLRRSEPPLDSRTNFMLLRAYFKTNGIELKPPETFFLNGRNNNIVVRTTAETQTNIMAALARLNSLK